MKQHNNRTMERGVSLYLTIVILAVLLAISLGLSSILIIQIKVIIGMEESVAAFYAADAGVERELYTNSALGTTYYGFLDLDGDGQLGSGVCPDGLAIDPDDTCYKVLILAPGVDCAAPTRCIKVIGIFRQTRRAIEVMK